MENTNAEKLDNPPQPIIVNAAPLSDASSGSVPIEARPDKNVEVPKFVCCMASEGRGDDRIVHAVNEKTPKE